MNPVFPLGFSYRVGYAVNLAYLVAPVVKR